MEGYGVAWDTGHKFHAMLSLGIASSPRRTIMEPMCYGFLLGSISFWLLAIRKVHLFEAA